ncbi:MAG: ABC transporter substrate-binding protein [Limnochordia bacterium]
MLKLKTGAVMVLSLCLAFSMTATAKSVKLVFQYRGGGLRTEAAEAWIAEFEAENPDIEVEFYPAPSGFTERTMISWIAGVGPDVTEVYGDWGQDYARNGMFADLRPYVQREFSQKEILDFWPVAWEASFIHWGDHRGEQYLIPRYMITTVHYYNIEHFESAGLEDLNRLDAKRRWTYEVLRDYAKKLTVSDGQQITRYGFTTNTKDYRRLDVWARAFGAGFFNLADPREFWGTRDETVKAMTQLQEMIWSDRSTAPSFARGNFFKGLIGIVEEGNHSVLDQFDRTIAGGFRWNLAPSPVSVNGRKAYSADNGFGMWRDTPHPEEAWRFIRFLTSTRGNEIAAKYEGLAPVRRSAMPFYQQLAPELNLGVLFTNMEDPGPPLTPLLVGNVKNIADTLNNALDSTLIKNEKPWAIVAEEIKPLIETWAKE